MKLSLYILLTIVPLQQLTAQIKSTAYIVAMMPTMYNNADSSIKVLKAWLTTPNNAGDVNYFSKIALYHLYQYKCAYKDALAVLEITPAVNTENTDAVVAAKIIRCMYALQQNPTAAIDADLAYLERAITKNTLPYNTIQYYFLLANKNNKRAESMLQHYTIALDVAKKYQQKELQATCYLQIAKVLLQKKSMYEAAIVYLDSAKKITTLYNYKRLQAQIELCYGDILSHQSKYAAAIQLYEKCLINFTNIQDIEGIVSSYKYLGNAENSLDNTANAIKYYATGIAISTANNFTPLLPVLNQNIGNTYLDLNGDSAKFYLEKAILLAQQLYDEHVEAFAIYNLSEYYASINLYKKSKAKKYEALAIFKKLDETNNVSWVLPQIVKLELAQIKKLNTILSSEKSKQLLPMLDEAMALNADGNSYVNLESIYGSYITIAQLKQDFKTAAIYQAKLIALKDTVFKNQRVKDALETSERLKTTEQKLKIAQLEVENTKSRIFNYSLMALVLITILSAIVVYRNYRKKMKQKSSNMLIAQKEEFRNQLAADLHDEVGSMLTGLAMQSEMLALYPAIDNRTELTEISKLSKDAMEQMREIVWTLDSRKDKYENLFNRLKYLAEQQLNIKQIEHSFIINSKNTSAEILPEVRQNVYLIFKESISNILKHSTAKIVTITIQQIDGLTTLQILDNGNNLVPKNSDGLGIQNMQVRAKKINAQLSFSHTKNGFITTLIF